MPEAAAQRKAITGRDFISLANKKLGQEYVLGAAVPFDAGDYDGPWDCAEFVSWVVWKLTGKKYGFTKDGDTLVEPWTGAWLNDMVLGIVKQIPLGKAFKTPGAILLRRSKGGGHIGFYAGAGWTTEARGAAYGVCHAPSGSLGNNFRGWQYGILIPGVSYEEEKAWKDEG